MIKRIRDRPQRFFINADEERIIEERMQQCGMENRSAYFRKMATDGYVIKQDFDSLGKAIYELNKIGTNINQIAKTANTYGSETVLVSELEQLRKELKKIWQSLTLTE